MGVPEFRRVSESVGKLLIEQRVVRVIQNPTKGAKRGRWFGAVSTPIGAAKARKLIQSSNGRFPASCCIGTASADTGQW